MSCVISETRCIQKIGYTCEASRTANHGEVEWTQKGRTAQHGRPGVRRRKRVEVEGEVNMPMFPSS